MTGPGTTTNTTIMTDIVIMTTTGMIMEDQTGETTTILMPQEDDIHGDGAQRRKVMIFRMPKPQSRSRRKMKSELDDEGEFSSTQRLCFQILTKFYEFIALI